MRRYPTLTARSGQHRAVVPATGDRTVGLRTRVNEHRYIVREYWGRFPDEPVPPFSLGELHASAEVKKCVGYFPRHRRTLSKAVSIDEAIESFPVASFAHGKGTPPRQLTPEQIKNWRVLVGPRLSSQFSDEDIQGVRDTMQAAIDKDTALENLGRSAK